MKKLKTLLQCNYIFYILFIFSIIYSVLFINFIKLNSIYDKNSNIFTGYIISKKIDGDKLTLIIKNKEKLVVNYYFKTEKEKNNFNLKYGDYIRVYGKLNEPGSNTNFNLFNYKKYLYSKRIFYILDAKKIEKLEDNNKILYKLINIIENRCKKCINTKDYINTFILGNKSDIDILSDYQSLGVSHLFSISGMHVMLLVGLLCKLLKKVNEYLKFSIINTLLIIYMFLTGLTPSVIRACILFILFSINKILNLKIKNINIVLFLISIFLIINPFYLYDISFQFSFIISIFLILFTDKIKGNYIERSLKISLISSLSSFPILINNFYEVNYLNILYNLIFVPFISFIIFPLGIITFIFPPLDNIYYISIDLLEELTSFLSKFNTVIYFPKIPLVFVFIYYLILYLTLKFSNKKRVVSLLLIIIIMYNYNRIVKPQITFIDVGQGDSSLIRIYDRNILIDTGGKINFTTENWRKRSNDNNICNNALLPLFKSGGIKKIDYLIITHGDYDHMGEAINLVNNFKVENVIFNCGEYNDLEKDLIKVLDNKNIKYETCIKELNIDNDKLYFLQTKEYDNENDNSNVIYTEINGYKFMFMGDASSTTEEEIMNKYNLPNIDILKVGHHGSKTSSSEEFINEINPKYSVISVGKNNRYGHPNKEALKSLENSKIYRTDEDGSIMFKFKNNRLNIETCMP